MSFNISWLERTDSYAKGSIVRVETFQYCWVVRLACIIWEEGPTVARIEDFGIPKIEHTGSSTCFEYVFQVEFYSNFPLHAKHSKHCFSR